MRGLKSRLLRVGVPAFAAALDAGVIAVYPFVFGELALGTLRARRAILDDVARLPQIEAAHHEEVLELVNRRKLAGSGIGWVDTHLVAGALIAQCDLWTLDKPLDAVWQRVKPR
jgi:hypothetical protein